MAKYINSFELTLNILIIYWLPDTGRQGVMNDFYETYRLIFKKFLLLWDLLQRWEQHRSLMGIYWICSENASFTDAFRIYEQIDLNWTVWEYFASTFSCTGSPPFCRSAHYKRRAEETCSSHCGRLGPEAPSNKQESSIVGNAAPHFKPPKTPFSDPTAAPALQEHLAMSFYLLPWTGGHRHGFVCRRLWYDSRNGNEAMDLH